MTTLLIIFDSRVAEDPISSWFCRTPRGPPCLSGVCGAGGGRSEGGGADPRFAVLQMDPKRGVSSLRRENGPSGAVGMSWERRANEGKRN